MLRKVNFIKLRFKDNLKQVFLACLVTLMSLNGISQVSDSNDNPGKSFSNAKEFENKGDFFLSIAVEYHQVSKLPQAIEYYKKAIVEFEKDNRKLNIADSKAKVGEIYSEVNDYAQTIQNYLQALELYEEVENENKVVKIISSIGEAHLSFENYSKALEYFRRANKLYQKDSIKYKQELRNNNILLGVSYGSSNRIDSSLFYFEKVLAQTDSVKEVINYAGLLNNIGAIYSKRNENTKALQFYTNALRIFFKINNESGIGIALSNIAYIRKKEGKNAEAISDYNKAISYLKKNNELTSLSDAYFNLSEAYESIKEFKMALNFSRLYIQLNDSLKNSELLNQVADLEMQQEIRKKDQEIKILDQQKQLYQKDLKLRKMWFYIVGVTGLFILLVGYLLLRRLRNSLKKNQQKQKILHEEKGQLKDDLEYKSKELEKFAFHIIEKNELLLQLKNELKEISSQHETDNSRVKEISSSITNNLLIEKDRKEFEFQLDKIQESFFLKLSNLHPDLTKNERRLCSLIIMGLSSKDIATILNVSPDGVKKSRYRLRKKLSLLENDNIADYLTKI